MPVYTYVKEEAVQQPAYSDKAISLAEAAIEVALNESLLGKTKEKVYEKVVVPARNKVSDALDRVITDKEKKDTDKNLHKTINRHAGEAKDAIKEYEKLNKKVRVGSDGKITGLTNDEMARYQQLTNIVLQNAYQ